MKTDDIKIDFLIKMLKNMTEKIIHKNDVEKMIKDIVWTVSSELINV